MAENGFGEYKNLIMHELEQQNEEMKEMRKAIEQIRVQVTALKVKSGVWGFAGAALPVMAFLLFEMVKKAI